mmetsp:Transcript_7332/g.15202  ORF Transcript_7332/g.15202 Transcript_7332/m.15202 type:complete len:308 (+) Transcript_7332:103-1026(+)
MDANSVGTLCPEVNLHTIHNGERAVAFSTAGDLDGTPTLFFYPAGGNRRMLYVFHAPAVAASLRLICVNRPGKGRTSRAEANDPEAHTTTACHDAVAVLDALGVQQASLLFMCAGTPFALALATARPERITGRLMGVASWVLPGDCSAAKALYRVGAALPSWLVSPIVAGACASINGTVSLLPQSTLASAFKSDLKAGEREAFDAAFPDAAAFAGKFAWMQEESGGESKDMAVLLGTSGDVGVDYGSISGQVLLHHGEEDTMVPIVGVEWMAEQMPSATLQRLEQCSHSGALWMFHQSIADSLKMLR